DDVQAAHLGDLAAFFLRLLFRLDLVNGGLPLGLGNVEARGVLVAQLRPRHRLRVAAQDDVGASTGHVGRDGDGPDAAGLGDDVGLAGGVFGQGVEQLVLDAALA